MGQNKEVEQLAEEVVEQFSISKVSVLDENGNVNGDIGNLSPDDLRTMYWYMNLSRLLDDKMLNMQKQGKLGTFASIRGQEGGQVAIAQAVKGISNIWYAPTFRENALMTALEIPMDKILQYWGGFEEGSQIDPKFNMLPVSIPIGSQLNHAVGIARAMQIKGEQGAVFGFLGDGATSEGETHEAMNYAGMWNSPVIFFCQNNHFAISVRREHQTAAKTLAQKAIAYGYEGAG